MTDASDQIEALRAALAAAEARAAAAEAEVIEAARERAVLASAEATIAALRLEIEKLRRALYGTRSERKARLLDQLELQLEELEATATADDLAAEALGAAPVAAAKRERRRAVRKPFPAHLPRERVVVPAPACCEACGSGRIVRLGEDVTETLEV
ncbi:MAG TPA: IS66 family transposase, partial [Amaricoccus sp.]|nr:IS66 family transposase [Amaricoccus sp.]